MGGTQSASNGEDVPALAWRQSEPADFSVGGGRVGAGLDPAGQGRVGGRTLLQINRQIFVKQTGIFWCQRSADGRATPPTSQLGPRRA